MLPPATAGPRQWRTEAGQLTRDQIDTGREEKAGGGWCMGSELKKDRFVKKWDCDLEEIQLEGPFCKISRLTITPHRAPSMWQWSKRHAGRSMLVGSN